MRLCRGMNQEPGTYIIYCNARLSSRMPATVMAVAAAASRPWTECGGVCLPGTGKLQLSAVVLSVQT